MFDVVFHQQFKNKMKSTFQRCGVVITTVVVTSGLILFCRKRIKVRYSTSDISDSQVECIQQIVEEQQQELSVVSSNQEIKEEEQPAISTEIRPPKMTLRIVTQERVFIAVPLPSCITTILSAAQGRMKRDRKAKGISWVQSHHMHMTLQFLGEMKAADEKNLETALSVELRSVQCFDLCLSSLGVFPSNSNPRVLWAGVSGELNPLHSLQQKVAAVCESLQLSSPDGNRSFHPHITIARVKSRNAASLVKSGIDNFAADEISPFTVSEVHLMKSLTVSEGSVSYELVKRYPLLI